MREILNTVEKISSYASGIGIQLTKEEAELIYGYVMVGSDYSLELNEEGLLFLVDNFGYFGDESFSFADILEMLTKSNVEFLKDAWNDCIENPSEHGYKMLSQAIAEQEIVSGLWKRMVELVCE